MVTHLNWGSSYLVVDFYARFLRPGATEAHLVLVSRLVTAGLMLLAAAFMFLLTTAGAGFQILLSVGAGTGLIYLLRWFWWRINAWGEIAAMASSFALAVGIHLLRQGGLALSDHAALLVSVAATTVIWLAVTLLTPPVERSVLERFYEKVRPAGPGWAEIRRATGLPPSPDSLPQALLGWSLGCAFIYGALFATGNLLFGRVGLGLACALVAGASGFGLFRVLSGLLRRPEA
jgi:hypothetical protein